MNSQLDYPVAPTRVGCIARAVSKTRFGRLVKCSGNVRIDIFLSPDSIQTLEFTWPSNALCATSCKRRLLPSRVGGGWNEQARQAETGHVKAAEIEAPSSGSGSQQNGRTGQPTFSGVQTRIPTCHRRIHRVVLLRATTLVQQSCRHALSDFPREPRTRSGHNHWATCRGPPASV
jgi:hypothetical protein